MICLFLILLCYAVKSEDISNYYVVEMPEDDTPQTTKEYKKEFRVYWNVPTMQCASKKIPFLDLYEKFGIIQNKGDRFNGDRITILYEPGDFPAIFKNETSGKYRLRNGGVPQEGNLEEHLDAFKLDLNQTIPDPDFDGVGIIDFESWRPVFRQNFGVLVPYKDVSIEIEKQMHWWWPKAWIQAQATQRFEAAARRFMQTTLSIAKQMRPKALWGYYGFPHCFNIAANNMKETCAKNVPEENDGIYWLWSESTAIYPSIYSSSSLSSSQLSSLINGRVKESVRVRYKNTPVFPYFWFRYRDAGFMKQEDLSVALSTLYQSKASGLIIWGSSNDVKTVNKCKKLYNYVETILGPSIAKYTQQNGLKDEIDNEVNNTLTTAEPLTTETIDNITASMKTGQMDPEYDWVPPKNYTEDISQQVDEELTKKGFNKTENKELDILSEGIVIDLIYDALVDAQNNKNIKHTTRSVDNNDESSENSDVTKIVFNFSDLFSLNDKSTQEEPNIISEFTNNDQSTQSLNSEVISTEISTIVSQYTESSRNTETVNSEVTEKYETGESTTNKESQNLLTTEDVSYDSNLFSSSEETSDYLIKVDNATSVETETSSENSDIDSSDDSDYLIILRDSIINKIIPKNENDEDEFITKSQTENVTGQTDKYFDETTDDSDQVVTYIYSK